MIEKICRIGQNYIQLLFWRICLTNFGRFAILQQYFHKFQYIYFKLQILQRQNSMITKYTMKTLLIHIALITLAFCICLDPLQPQGKCTACASIQTLINGACFPKIRGCLKHITGPKCSQCQFGYVLSTTTCIREGVFFNRTNLSDIPPVRISPTQSLTFQDIRAKMGQQYGSFFTDAHEYFVSKYTNELGKGNIKDVQVLQTKTGPLIIINYEGSSSQKYEAVAKKNPQGRIQQWSFGPTTAQKRDPATADTLIKKFLGTKLNGYTLYHAQQEGDIFTFDYINDKNQVLRVKINRNDLNETNIAANLATKITASPKALWQLAFEEFLKKYPEYSSSEVTLVKRVDQFYVVSLGESVSFSYRFNNYQFTINKPIDQPITSYLPNSATTTTMIGGWGDFTDLFNSDFQIAINFIAKQFPDTKQAKIYKLKNQIVAGTNYYIVLRRPIPTTANFDEYQFLVWLRLDKIAEMIEARLNTKLIYQRNYNYNTDSIFLSSYKVVDQSKVLNIPPINSVTFKEQKNRRYYKVIYSKNQYSEFQYLTDSKVANLLSYNIDGEDVSKTLKGSLIQSSQRSSDVLLQFIKSQNSNLTIADVESVDYKAPTYLVTIVSTLGKFKAQITDKGGLLVLNQLNQISNVTCYDMNLDLPKNQEKIKLYTDFLKQNYPIQFFQVRLVQIRLQPVGPLTRLILANYQEKLIQIVLQETAGTVSVIKASYINFGYQTVSPASKVPEYGKILQTISSLKGSKVPLYTEQNGTLYHSYYDDTKSTYEIFYDIKADKARTQVISTRPYYLVPEGFSLSGLLVPGEAPDADKRILNNIVQDIITKFNVMLLNSALVYASKTDNTYNLMFKNSFGYQRVEVNVTNGVITSYGKLILTAYKDTDFSNCKKFDSSGKCLSCNQATQVQYQGYCFDKIQGCEIQPGKFCVKCDVPYARSNQRCFKQCTYFFR